MFLRSPLSRLVNQLPKLALISIVALTFYSAIALAQPAYPLKASTDKRYLVDQNNQPVLLIGDSPHAMFAALSTSEAATYLANRASYGINIIWVQILCGSYIANCRADYSTKDGLVPFSTPGDISTPNPAFFSRIDAMLSIAAQNGITILMDAWETGGEMPLLEANGATKAFNYGVFLGNRYKNYANIIWITGNDFQTWNSSSTDNNLIKSIMQGIASVDPNHLQTSQLNYTISGSHDDALLLPYTNLAAVYSYSPQYAEIYKEYNSSPTLPVFMEEANYEGENDTGMDPSTSKLLRQQEYWSILGGALAGQMYGSYASTYFLNGWQTGLDTPGVAQLRIMKNFFTARQWWGLVPDQNHTVVTSGYGTFTSTGAVHTNNYVTTARMADGSRVIAYTPASATLTVDMTKLNSMVTARWFDPVNGNLSTISGSPFPNTGSRNFTTPGNNSGADTDWVLTLETGSDLQSPSAPSNLTATAAGASQINLSWTASTDNIGVTGYQIERCLGAGCTNFVQISSPSSGAILAPLTTSSTNPRYFIDGNGTPIILNGSHTWNNLLDWGTNGSIRALDFSAYVNFLVAHGHNFTFLWRTELTKFCALPTTASSPPDFTSSPQPWQRNGPGTASDGGLKFDLNKFDQAFFDRLRTRVQQLNAAGIYTGVYFFTGEWLNAFRCTGDGYPLSSANNINGIDDGGGIGSMTMSAPNSVTAIQDALVDKMIDTLNDLPNVLWIVSEEAPPNSTWWNNHLISHVRTYEAAKPSRHPIGYAVLSNLVDSTVYNSDADWIAPFANISPTSSCGTGTPHCKVNINDSDHSYYAMWNDSAQTNRSYAWRNFTTGNQVAFMDPYVVYYPRENRNLCPNPVNGICPGVDTRWNNFRDNLGYILNYSRKLNMANVSPQPGLSSTANCLAQTPATGAEYLVYAPSGGTFTVNLSATTRQLSVEWFNPSTGAVTAGTSVVGGSSSQSFTPPFSGDAVLYLVDASGHANSATITNPLSYINTGLATGTSYRFRVRSTDLAGNLSPYSNIASAATTAEALPPNSPSNLRVMP